MSRAMYTQAVWLQQKLAQHTDVYSIAHKGGDTINHNHYVWTLPYYCKPRTISGENIWCFRVTDMLANINFSDWQFTENWLIIVR